MVNQMSNYLLSLMLVLFVVGQVTVKGSETCSQFIAGCLDTPSCDSYCKEQYSDGNGICANERCICNFTCGGKPGKKAPKRDCEVNLGFCDNGGSPSCNDKCSSRYQAGTGYCDASIDPRFATCTCLYVC
ncbi:defensin-like protein 183 [Medicago truncatula]|uniref:Defensin-like protein n=2 Tax=Medicago truncatula TaxID=3880 RepID=Q2HS04_MEDTR|nr:defensin-like protein 183 [Medicago truncatula]ABD33383.2 Low-molecular-weight cysteine-rich protein lcr19 precursor, putative [Medicago truncatula]KEH37422.1 Defensin fusion [Medicago truncatula]